MELCICGIFGARDPIGVLVREGGLAVPPVDGEGFLLKDAEYVPPGNPGWE